jgi:cell division protein FtsA
VITSDTIVGIDVGTTKICTVVASMGRDNEMSIIGIGRVPSRGLRKGSVIDLERTIASVRESKIQAEQSAGVEIESAYVSVTGGHIKAKPSNAVIAIADPQKGITEEDAEHALELAQRVDIPKGRRLIDVRIKDYIVDGQVGISDPVGMTGMRLEVNVLLVTAAVTHLENIYRAVNHAGIDVENIILEPIASAEAVLSPEERLNGVALIDIGGGTTDLAVYRDDGVAHLAIFPVGGDHFDSDLAYGIGITARQAEHLKIKLGGVSRDYTSSEDIIEISKRGGQRTDSIPLKIIAEIIRPRLEEIFALVHENLRSEGYLKDISGGVVLTGGTSLLPGITEIASSSFGVQARIGYPRIVDNMPEDLKNPMFATAVGLVKIGAEDYLEKKMAAVPNGMSDAFVTIQGWGKTVLRSIFR